MKNTAIVAEMSQEDFKVFLANAFSIQMMLNAVDKEHPALVKISEVDASEIANADFKSAIGHQDTANVLSSVLGKPVQMNRVSIQLEHGVPLYVAQLCGGRLPERTTTLPEGFFFRFFKVELV